MNYFELFRVRKYAGGGSVAEINPILENPLYNMDLLLEKPVGLLILGINMPTTELMMAVANKELQVAALRNLFIDLHPNDALTAYENLQYAKLHRKDLNGFSVADVRSEFRNQMKSATKEEKAVVRQLRADDRQVAFATGQKNFEKAMGSKAAQFGMGIGISALLGLDAGLMGDKNFGAGSAALDATVHTTSKALLASGNPYAIAAAGALEAGNFLTKAGGLTVEGFDVDIQSSGYGNMGHKASQSSRDFGALIGLGGVFTKGLENRLAKRNEEAQMALKASNVADTIKYELEARMNSVDDVIQLNKIALAGGIDTSLLAAKKGAKLVRLEEFRKQLVEKAKYGRKLKKIEVSEKENILPTGALHKELNHLDKELDITRKGIPVILGVDDSLKTFEEIKLAGGELVLSAEIESLEIIFSKETTDFIELGRKKWHESDEKDNDICEEVGKRITKEILTNTKDVDGLIKKLEKDGKNKD